MSYKHLKELPYYENLFDRITVKSGRRNIVHYEKFHAELESKLDPADNSDTRSEGSTE